MLCLKLEDISEDMIFSRQELYFMGFSSISEWWFFSSLLHCHIFKIC